jgi:hypothetical protein
MPLRDHFRAPLDNLRHWEGFHATWPVMMVAQLRARLPHGFFAEPRVHSGSSAEIDVASFERQDAGESLAGNGSDNGGGTATAVWAPPRPFISVPTALPTQDVYEVLVYDEKRRCRLVAAVEIVSPGNKDRPESRRMFVSKCMGLLRERVSIIIVDVVTTRTANLYAELMADLGQPDSTLGAEPLSAAACRLTEHSNEWRLEAWPQALRLGQPLPTQPLWLTTDLAVPLELEESYEQSCSLLGIS